MMGLPDAIHDTRHTPGIFPIEDTEAACLRDLGWSSGYGWRNEWDWWQAGDQTNTEGIESRETHETKVKLMNHLFAIRAARNAADELAVKIIAA